MAKLIEIDNIEVLPSKIILGRGDMLLFKASGGYVESGTGVIELLGPFLPGIMQNNGEILSPMGAPNTVLFLARDAGNAKVRVITGDPWVEPVSKEVEVWVEG